MLERTNWDSNPRNVEGGDQIPGKKGPRKVEAPTEAEKSENPPPQEKPREHLPDTFEHVEGGDGDTGTYDETGNLSKTPEKPDNIEEENTVSDPEGLKTRRDKEETRE